MLDGVHPKVAKVWNFCAVGMLYFLGINSCLLLFQQYLNLLVLGCTGVFHSETSYRGKSMKTNVPLLSIALESFDE